MKVIHLNQIKFQFIQLSKYPIFIFLNLINLSILLFFIFFVHIEYIDNNIKSVSIGSLHLDEETLYRFIPLFTKDIFEIYQSLLLFLITIGYSYFLVNLYKNDLTVLSLLKNISRKSYFFSYLLSFFLMLSIVVFLFSIFLDTIIYLKIESTLIFIISKNLFITFIKIILLLSLLNLISILTKNFTLIFLIGLLLYFLILPSFNLINNGTLRTLLNFITGNIIYFQSVRFNFGVVPNLSSIDIVYPLIYVLVCYLISFLHFNKYDFR